MHSTLPPSPLRQATSTTTRARATSEASTSRYFQDLGTRPSAASSFLSAGIPNPYGAASGGAAAGGIAGAGWQSNMDDGTFATSGFGFYPSPLPSPSPTDHDPMNGSSGSGSGKRHDANANAQIANPHAHAHVTTTSNRSVSSSSSSSSRTQNFFSTDHRPELLLPPRPLSKEPSSPLRDGFSASPSSGGGGGTASSSFLVSGLNRARSMHERRSSRQLEAETSGGGSVVSLDEGHASTVRDMPLGRDSPTGVYTGGAAAAAGSSSAASLDRASSLKRRQHLYRSQQQEQHQYATPGASGGGGTGSPKSNDLFKTSFAVAPPSKSMMSPSPSGEDSAAAGAAASSEFASGGGSSVSDSPTVLSPVSPTFGIAAVSGSGKASGWSSLGRGPSPTVVASRLGQLQQPPNAGGSNTPTRAASMPVNLTSASSSTSASSTPTAARGLGTMHDATLQPITRVPTLLPPSPASTHGFSAFHHGGGAGETVHEADSASRPASTTSILPLVSSSPQSSSPLTPSLNGPTRLAPPVRRLTREPSNFEHRPIRRGFRIGPVGDDQPDQGKRQWELEELMGAGAFSVVWSARECRPSSEGDIEVHESKPPGLVAIKMMDRRICRENDRTRVSFLREVAVLKQISHPHIVSYVSSFWTPEYNCLVLEHLSGGELFELLQQPGNHKRMDEPLLRRIFTELCRGIHWLHVAGIVHRDIKLENIMFTANPFTTTDLPATLVKITDFGLARFIDPASPLLRTRCGSESFAAPEIVMGQPYDGRKTDAWATGVLLFTLITGELPFDSSGSSDDTTSRRKRMMRIARGTYEWPSANSGSEGVRRVVGKLLVRDPARRSNIDRSLWDEPWMQGPGAVSRPGVYESREPVDGRKAILDGYLIEDTSSDLSHQEIS